MIFEAIIVDDEAPARVELINQLEETGRVKVVAEAVCLQEGIAKMKKGGIDVAFIEKTEDASEDEAAAELPAEELPDAAEELPVPEPADEGDGE